MEVLLSIKDDEIWDDDLKAELIKGIYRKFPNALWEKSGRGYKILIS